MLKVIPLSSLAKVFSDEEPKEKPRAYVSLLRNEKSSLQIALTSDVDCSLNVDIQSSIIDEIQAYCVEEIYSSMPIAKNQDDYVLRKQAGMFPELLHPLKGSIEIKADKWYSVWVSVNPAESLPVGKQAVDVVLSGGGDEKRVELNFDVIDAYLPKQTLIYTNWFHSDCLATYYGVKVFSPDYWRIVRNYLSLASEYGMNMVLTPIFTPPLDTKRGGERLTVQLIGVSLDRGEYTFDFSNLDKWIDLCREAGIEYFEMAHLFTQWGAKRCPKIIAAVDGVEKRIFGWNTRGAGKKYKAFLAALAPKLKEYLTQKGVADKVYFHVSDEPFAGVIGHYKKASAIVKENFGEFKIIDALSDYKFYEKGLTQLPIPANDHVSRFIGKVDELWTYYCSAQVDKVANRFFAMPSQRSRVLGCQLYKFDVKGFLHWGYNFWYKRLSLGAIDPFKESDAGGFFPSGDSYVVYPDKDGGVLLSLRLKVFCDALQDMRAMQLLESMIGKDAVMKIVEKDVDTPIAFDSYPHSDEWQLQMRESINDEIRRQIAK